MKKVIVTGATGFIGSAFVEYLALRNVEVLALGRKALDHLPEHRRRKLRNVDYLQLDMSEISALGDVLTQINWKLGQDCIFFNLAWGGEKSLSDVNIEAQLRNASWSVSAIEVAKRIGCTRFVQVGTMEESFTEKYLELDHRRSSQHNRHVIYSVAKMVAKNSLKIKAGQLGIDFNYVLHSHVMGPNDDKDSFLQVTLQKLIRGDELIFSTGEQYFDVISLEDCALGYYLICQKGKAGRTYWVGSGEPRHLREYVERMYRLYPSKQELQFGRLSYNDVVLPKDAFSIASLVEDTDYEPTMTYEESVHVLYESLVANQR
jgi:nucleoside-diphosphate-sugar epimerase